MDFIERLPHSHGKSTVLVVVDRLLKYAHFIAIPHHYTAESIAHVFFDQVFQFHGMPHFIAVRSRCI